MRDLVIESFLVGSLPFILARPYVGLVMWFVVSFLNPHQLAYGFISSAPVAMMVGGATLLGFAFSPEQKRFPVDATITAILMLMVWMTVTTFFSLVPTAAWEFWNRAIKVLGMTLMMVPLITNRQRLHGVIWSLVISIDYFGVRGGLFTVLIGGGRVLGPAGTMMSDNNQLATALIMILPLVRYLQLQTQNRYVRMGLFAALGLTIVSIFGSYSRGALIGITIMFLWLLRSSRHKGAILLSAIIGLAALYFVMPDSWFERMNTIEDYQSDGSANGRLDAWKFAYRLAMIRPLVGGGFRAFLDGPLFFQLVPDAAIARASHSIYFEVLGEHGFVGLGIFLGLLACVLIKTSIIRRKAKSDPQLAWAYDLASMVQVSIVGYMAAGAFLEMAFFDLFYAIAMLPTLAGILIAREAQAEQRAPALTVRPMLARASGG